MSRFQTSWEIAKRSWAVLKSDKTLAWFPVLSALGSLLVVAIIGGLIAVVGIDSKATGDSLQPIGWVLIVVAYLALAIVQTYFLAALVAGADQRLRGNDSTVRTALDIANSRLHRLLPWAIVTATVTMVLQAIEERFGIVGTIVARLVGLAWNLVTFLVVPILVLEDLGVGDALEALQGPLQEDLGRERHRAGRPRDRRLPRHDPRRAARRHRRRHRYRRPGRARRGRRGCGSSPPR